MFFLAKYNTMQACLCRVSVFGALLILLPLGAKAQTRSALATIYPNASGTEWIMSVAWSETSGLTVYGNEGSDLDDPSVLGDNTYILPSGPAAGAEVRYGDTTPESNSTVAVEWCDPLVDTLGVTNPPSVALKWDDVGEFIDYGNLTYGSGVAGVTALAGGPAGVYFDDDGVGNDDVGILLPGSNMPTAGCFIVTAPIPAGSVFTNIFKPGMHYHNPDIILNITTNPLAAVVDLRPTASGDSWLAAVLWTQTDSLTVYGNEGSDLDDPSVLGDNTYILPSGPAAGAEVRYGDTTPESNSTVAVEWCDPLVDTLGVTNSASIARKWDDVAEFTDYGNLTYGSGVAGVTALAGGPAGIYFDDDGVGNDDVGILLPGTVVPSAGCFIVTAPLPSGSTFTDIFKIGTQVGGSPLMLLVSKDPETVITSIASSNDTVTISFVGKAATAYTCVSTTNLQDGTFPILETPASGSTDTDNNSDGTGGATFTIEALTDMKFYRIVE